MQTKKHILFRGEAETQKIKKKTDTVHIHLKRQKNLAVQNQSTNFKIERFC